MAKKKTRIIQVPMPESLVYSLDRLSEEHGESRASVIREAAAQYVAKMDEAEAVRRYIESYEELPETEEERAWNESVWKDTAERWAAEEDWSEEYEAFLKERRETR